MTDYARFNVFGIVYGPAYVAFFLYSEFTKYAMFRYYPVLGGFRTEALPLETAGPAISDTLAGRSVRGRPRGVVHRPRASGRKADHRWVWLVPTALLIGILVYERRWFY